MTKVSKEFEALTVIVDLRAAWFSTPSRVKRPCEPLLQAVIRAVALGKHELGHMYLRMKSSALRGCS